MSRMLIAMLLPLGIVGWSGCEYTPLTGVAPATATSRPEGATAAATRPDPSIGRVGPGSRAGMPMPTVVDVGPPGQVIQLAPPSPPATTQRDTGMTTWPGVPAIAVGLPPGVRPQLRMDGQGRAPLAGDDASRQRATMQAALFVAIYNITGEINPESFRDQIDKGYITTDHFIYRDGPRDGLVVKSRQVIIEGLPRQFDVWLLAPAGPAQEAIQVHVLNHRLVGDALDGERLARLLAAAGGHLIVTQLTGPDAQGRCTVEVALVRKAR